MKVKLPVILVLAVMIIMLPLMTYAGSEEFFERVNYKGAFGSTNWAAGWTALSQYGFFAQATEQTAEEVEVFDADIASGTTVYWTADKTYYLNGRVFVDDGAVLNIEAGTVIKGREGEGENASALIVARGGKIYAEGTAQNPIIFTAAEDDLNNPLIPPATQQGLWGGVIILGKATINFPGGETNIEGIPTTEQRGLYGGGANPDDDDCSGVFKYVSIRHGGTEIGEGNEINGLTMGGVGRGTVISYVEVYSNRDDGFEWFGGTVNCDHLVVANCGDDAIDIDFGLNNKMQFIFVVQADTTGDHLGEHDGADEDYVDSVPFTHSAIYNATYLGAGIEGKSGKRIFRLRENFGGEYKNCIFGDYNGWGVTVEDKYTPDAIDRLEAGDLQIENNIWFDLSVGANWLSIADSNQTVADYLVNAGNTYEDPMLNGISRAQDNGLDPRPAADGPAYQNLADIETSVRVINNTSVQPKEISLMQNYPNPFNPTTTIEFALNNSSKVNLSIFNVMGQKVATLVDARMNAGVHNVNFDASSLTSGIYFYRLEANNVVMTKKLTLIK